jgi:thioesterase domain-containing protein
MWRRQVRKAPVRVEDVVAHAAEVPAHHRRLMELHLRATRDYLPAAYEGAVTLFNVASQSLLRGPDPLRGWGRLARGGVEVRRVAGSHHTLLKQPHVPTLARALRAGLDAADTAHTGGNTAKDVGGRMRDEGLDAVHAAPAGGNGQGKDA